MKPLSDEFTAFIGIARTDRKHGIFLQGVHSDRREFSRIEHKVDAIDQRAIPMRQRFGGPIAVALELTKGPLVAKIALSEMARHRKIVSASQSSST